MTRLLDKFLSYKHKADRAYFVETCRMKLADAKETMETYSNLKADALVSVFVFGNEEVSRVDIPATPEIFEAVQAELMTSIVEIENFLEELKSLSKEELGQGTLTDKDYFSV